MLRRSQVLLISIAAMFGKAYCESAYGDAGVVDFSQSESNRLVLALRQYDHEWFFSRINSLDIQSSVDPELKQLCPKHINTLMQLLENDPENAIYAPHGFKFAGPEAIPKIPRLVELLQRNDVRLYAAQALGSIGPPAAASLTNGFASTNEWIRQLSVHAFRYFIPPNADTNVTTLLKGLMNDVSENVMLEALRAGKDQGADLEPFATAIRRAPNRRTMSSFGKKSVFELFHKDVFTELREEFGK